MTAYLVLVFGLIVLGCSGTQTPEEGQKDGPRIEIISIDVSSGDGVQVFPGFVDVTSLSPVVISRTYFDGRPSREFSHSLPECLSGSYKSFTRENSLKAFYNCDGFKPLSGIRTIWDFDGGVVIGRFGLNSYFVSTQNGVNTLLSGVVAVQRISEKKLVVQTKTHFMSLENGVIGKSEEGMSEHRHKMTQVEPHDDDGCVSIQRGMVCRVGIHLRYQSEDTHYIIATDVTGVLFHVNGGVLVKNDDSLKFISMTF